MNIIFCCFPVFFRMRTWLMELCLQLLIIPFFPIYFLSSNFTILANIMFGAATNLKNLRTFSIFIKPVWKPVDCQLTIIYHKHFWGAGSNEWIIPHFDWCGKEKFSTLTSSPAASAVDLLHTVFTNRLVGAVHLVQEVASSNPCSEA